MAELPGPLAELTPLLDRYGYAAIAGLVMVESFGAPVPAQTLLIAAGVYAGAGRMDPVAVASIGFVAATGGDSIGYWIGRLGGRRMVLRLGRYVFLTENRLRKVEGLFERHGGKIVSVARFVDGLRQFNGVVAGIVEMSWWRFLAFNALGALIWASVWTMVGRQAGRHIDVLFRAFHRYQPYVFGAVAIVALAVVGHWWWRRRGRRTAGDV